jgi:hypothetical protein
LKAQSGLIGDEMPCRTAYERAKKKLGIADITGYPATVTSNAEVRITNRKAVYAARPGPMACEPATIVGDLDTAVRNIANDHYRSVCIVRRPFRRHTNSAVYCATINQTSLSPASSSPPSSRSKSS